MTEAMKRFLFLSVVASVFFCIRAQAAQRPRYGGALRIEVSSPRPAMNAEFLSSENASATQIAPLVYETLVNVSRHDELRPALAVSWKSEQNFSRWEFQLRPNVRFQDGKPLTAVAVAESLRTAGIEATAKVSATGDQ